MSERPKCEREEEGKRYADSAWWRGRPGVEGKGRREWAAAQARKGEEKRMNPWVFFLL